MLKNIRLHIEKDEEKQAILDKNLAQHILQTQNKNINAFQRNIPSILPFIESVNLSSHSLFCNKFGEFNIVDYGQGRVLYGFHPKEEVVRQVEFVKKHCVVTNIDGNTHSKTNLAPEESDALDYTQLSSYTSRKKQQGLPSELDCLVVLGCGLGLHIEQLLTNHKIKFLIIYEPQLQYFQCSAMSLDWANIFELAKENGTAIFIQLEKDGRDLISDISELSDNYPISKFYLFKHYNHDVFDSIELALSTKNWHDTVQNGFSIYTNKNYTEYVPLWTESLELDSHAKVETGDQRLSRNLQAFKKYFPEIFKQFNNYSPKNWLPIKNKDDEINLLKKDSLCTWYGDSPKEDCNLNFENFNSQPNKDGLVLGYSGTKLAHYLHYQFVKETENLLKDAEEEEGELPESVASIIMFGLGTGYQLERLLDFHTVEKLFICEPNTDFFYASLFAIDWEKIFAKVESSKARIYLNIGDDGSNLFRDLLNQFHSIGPYILNNTYFYQSYYNSSLNTAIAQLREQLQVVISMGEYFDHAYYGIEHTKEILNRGYPALRNNPHKALSFESKDVPVFIIGNGPSLDSAIEEIKESRSQAILISCGTALQVMFKHGIVPDFHAEIEQNRTTYDWPVLIGDLNYLKQITLISCNGIHPDTCDLYKDVLIAFKEGESSTVSALNALDETEFEVLQHAFPTVSNFACDLFSRLGFFNIYLIGVDLGFVDVKHHHSKSSGYYDEHGEENYDYSDKNNTSLIVKGNFRPTVNTKHEFKVARQIIEQITAKRPKSQIFYNCSDGAKIENTIALRYEDLLLVSPKEHKFIALKELKSKAYLKTTIENFDANYNQLFSQKLLVEELESYGKLISRKVKNNADLNRLINKQKEMLYSSYKTGHSLLFYYLYGTVNYANALLLKLSLANSDGTKISNGATECIRMWRETFLKINNHLTRLTREFDTSEHYRGTRENIIIRNKTLGQKLMVVTNSRVFAETAKVTTANHYPWLKHVVVVNPDNLTDYATETFDFIIYFLSKKFQTECSSAIAEKITNGQLPIGEKNCLIVCEDSIDEVRLKAKSNSKISILPLILDCQSTEKCLVTNLYYNTCIALKVCLSELHAPIIIPKYIANEEFPNKLSVLPEVLSLDNEIIVDFIYFNAVFFEDAKQRNLLTNFGTRGNYLDSPTQEEIFIWKTLPQNEFELVNSRHAQRVPNIDADTIFNESWEVL